MYRIGYDEPEECTTPCAFELPWAVPELPFYAFAAKEIIAQGAGDAFVFYRKFLQLMAWQTAERQPFDGFVWMLKCPFHLPYLRELHQTFPGATVVWTHRDPVECVASACSLYETILHMGMENHTVDRKALGLAVLEYTRLALDKAAETLASLGNALHAVHVRYADNVRDPMSVCRQILQQAGLEVTDEYKLRVEQYLADNAATRAKLKASKNKAEMHAYHLSDYGLTEDGVRLLFVDYINKYDLCEKKGGKGKR